MQRNILLLSLLISQTVCHIVHDGTLVVDSTLAQAALCDQEAPEETASSQNTTFTKVNMKRTNVMLKKPKKGREKNLCCKNVRSLPTIEDIEEVDTLERIPCTISRAEFVEQYETKRKPVILTDCDATWPAKEKWTEDALIPRFSNTSKWRAEVLVGKKRRWGMKEEVKWDRVVDAMTNEEPYYIFDQLDDGEARELRKDYVTPGPFQNGDLYDHLTNYPKDYGTMRWYCMGTPYTGTMPHMDPHVTDAWNTCISGYKWWVIYPSHVKEEEDVECDTSCSIKSAEPVNWYASVGVYAHHLQYGKSRKRPIQVLQKPGETIYVPNGRVHSVLNMEHTVAVTSNYASEGNLFTVFFNELIKKKNKNHWKKLYYNVLSKKQRTFLRKVAKDHYAGTPSRIGKWLCHIAPSEKNCKSYEKSSSSNSQTCKAYSIKRMFYDSVVEMSLMSKRK